MKKSFELNDLVMPSTFAVAVINACVPAEAREQALAMCETLMEDQCWIEDFASLSRQAAVQQQLEAWKSITGRDREAHD